MKKPASEDKVIFTTGWFGDGLNIVECSQYDGPASYRIENLGIFQVPPVEDPFFSSFEEALSYASEKWANLLTSHPHFIHAEYADPLRAYLENVLAGVTREERANFGETLPQTVEEWFDRLPPGSGK